MKEINADIDEALVAIKALKSWINEPLQDKHAERNIQNWLYKTIIRIERIAKKLRRDPPKRQS